MILSILKEISLNGLGIQPRKDGKGSLHFLNASDYEFNNAVSRALYLAKTNDKNFDPNCNNFSKKFKTTENIEPIYYNHIDEIKNMKTKEQGNSYTVSNSRDLVSYDLAIEHDEQESPVTVYVELFNFKVLHPLTENEIEIVLENIINKIYDYIEENRIQSFTIAALSHDSGIAHSIMESIESVLNEII